MSCSLVVYDIADPKRLRKVAKVMEAHGVRVQKSVFECDLNERRERRMLELAERVMVLEEDEVRLYRVSEPAVRNVLILGNGTPGLPEDAVVA